MFGIDEAGKGPVIGPMVVAAVYVPDKDNIPDGVTDSKRLSASRREKLANEIRNIEGVEISIVEVSTDDIDHPDSNMNELTVSAHAEAINRLPNKASRGFADASDVNEERFGKRVKREVDEKIQLTAKHGADDIYEVVSAASIIAKVKRDGIVSDINTEYDEDIGSGYPSDPQTRDFIYNYVEKTGELPSCVRTSWKTSTDIFAEAMSNKELK